MHVKPRPLTSRDLHYSLFPFPILITSNHQRLFNFNHPSKMPKDNTNLFTASFLITIIPFLFLSNPNPSAALGEMPLLGAWRPISDITDPTVIDIGKFAINQHNKQNHTSLKFAKIVKGESQVVAGMNYNLTITAVDGISDNNYVALVWDKPWEKFRQLVSFKGAV